MIQIVMKPVEKAPVVKGEGLYETVFNGEKLGLRVRAKRACEAERKLMIIFRHELMNKSIDFNADDYPLYDKEVTDEGKTEKTGGTENHRAENTDHRGGA